MISALILAAGESKRMGRPKMLLPWGSSTVLQTVISTLKAAGVDDIVVITGGAHKEVEALIGSTARVVFNKKYQTSEMLASIQKGLSAKKPVAQAALICLGDQPQVREESIRQVCEAYLEGNSPLVVPSYEMHRGHPWLVDHTLWGDLLAMQPPQTARDFLRIHSHQIKYVEMESPSVLQDLDTPEDYIKFKPQDSMLHSPQLKIREQRKNL